MSSKLNVAPLTNSHIHVELPLSKEANGKYFVEHGGFVSISELSIEFILWAPEERQKWLDCVGAPNDSKDNKPFYNLRYPSGFETDIIPHTTDDWLKIAEEYKKHCDNQLQGMINP